MTGRLRKKAGIAGLGIAGNDGATGADAFFWGVFFAEAVFCALTGLFFLAGAGFLLAETLFFAFAFTFLGLDIFFALDAFFDFFCFAIRAG
ncbi:MAG: hypothetical protein ACOY3I_02145 [Verrucomicrobiota bacterium]